MRGDPKSKGILAYGKRNIPKKFIGKLTREEYTKLWNDNCIIGILWALYNSKEKLCMEEIGIIIGWKRYSVKGALYVLKDSTVFEPFIKELKLSFPKKPYNARKVYYLIDEVKQLAFDQVKNIIVSTHFKMEEVESGPNKPENLLLEICEEAYPLKFRYTGRTILENRIGGKAPDLTCEEYKIVIEHFGSLWHLKEQEQERIDHFKSYGYKCLVIWDAEKHNKDKLEKEIKEFVDNAIQNVQQLVI